MPGLDLEQKPSRRLWMLAAAGALALHIGCGALAFAHLRGEEGADSLGAQGDIGIELTSASAEDTDLPAGPDADASVASPALAEQKAEPKQTELPKETPTETEDPDRVVTTADNNKPKEDDPKIATVQTSASEESVAQEASARQNIEGTRQSDTPTVIHQGIGKDAQKLLANWQRQIAAYLTLHLRYPEVAKPRPETVKVTVEFVLDRLGHIVSTEIVQGSGDAAYDAAAIEMFRKSDPVPRPPPAQADENLKFTQEVLFRPSDYKKKG
jgi:periplasmic protein TonB